MTTRRDFLALASLAASSAALEKAGAKATGAAAIAGGNGADEDLTQIGQCVLRNRRTWALLSGGNRAFRRSAVESGYRLHGVGLVLGISPRRYRADRIQSYPPERHRRERLARRAAGAAHRGSGAEPRNRCRGPARILPEPTGRVFRMTDEHAEPGYYAVLTETGSGKKIKTELTATERTGLAKFTFPEGEPAHILLDWQHGYGEPKNVKGAGAGGSR